MESTIVRKYPKYRNDVITSCQKWIEGKRLDDNAEGFWRVHDKLYDLTKFIEDHPGGKEWIKMTKGIDITEQFETHHITERADRLLQQFFVRDALEPRNYKITFDNDGFYKTLKRRVANKVFSNIDTKPISTSKFYCDLMLASTILSFILVARDYNFLTIIISATCLLMLTVISHNFIHQKDNWRMYLINISLQSFREWRVMHAMSHHLYPNSLSDLECTFFEPFLNWMPQNKSKLQKYGAIIISPVIYVFIFPMVFISRFSDILTHRAKFHWDDLLPFTIPLLMHIFGHSPILITLKMWISIVLVSSVIYGFMAVNGGHHHNHVFHDGDQVQSMDFGVYQLAATFDRTDSLDNHLFMLTTFGQHVLHHMFPTFDHGILPQLREILLDTCKEFEADLCIYPWYELLIGQFKQLTRTKIRKVEKRND